MFVRLTHIHLLPEGVEEVKKIFFEEIAPIVRQQPGCRDIMLLEPVDKQDAYLSCTMWQTKADADAYEARGLYNEMLNKAKDKFTKPPLLKAYNRAAGQ
jgi:heme-degrading monooxygenase HmoA